MKKDSYFLDFFCSTQLRTGAQCSCKTASRAVTGPGTDCQQSCKHQHHALAVAFMGTKGEEVEGLIAADSAAVLCSVISVLLACLSVWG